MGLKTGTRFKPRGPIRLGPSWPVLLYGFYDEGDGKVHTTASVGLVSSQGFRMAKTFAIDELPWYVDVYSATRAGTPWVLFHDHRDGHVETGVIDQNYSWVVAHRHPPGFLTSWRAMAVDGEGYLLLTKAAGAAKTKTALASVEPDGSVVVWWQSELGIPSPHFLLGMADAHLWLVVDDKANTSTAYVLHRGQLASQRTWDDVWRGVAAHGNLAAFYRTAQRMPGPPGAPPPIPPRVVVTAVGPDYQLTDQSDHQDWAFSLRVDTGLDVATAGVMFYVQRVQGPDPIMQVRSLTAGGYSTTLEAGGLPPPTPAAHARVFWKVAAC